MDTSPRLVVASSPRWTVRRLALLVAASSLLFSGWHGSGPYRGLFGRMGGHCVGACRADPFGRLLMGDGKPGGHQYQVGVWEDEPPGWLVAGVEWRDGQVMLRSRSSYWIVW